MSEFPPPSQHDDTHTILTKGKLVNNFKDRVEGLTFHMKPYHITLEEGAEPVVHPPRSVAVHLRDLYEQEIDQMLEAVIIAPVDTPTDWVNSIVLSETTDEKGNITNIRVCLDPRDLNKCVKRENHYTKTVDEIVTQLSKAKYFTPIDVPLDKESSCLTTIWKAQIFQASIWLSSITRHFPATA